MGEEKYTPFALVLSPFPLRLGCVSIFNFQCAVLWFLAFALVLCVRRFPCTAHILHHGRCSIKTHFWFWPKKLGKPLVERAKNIFVARWDRLHNSSTTYVVHRVRWT